ncbi:MAG: nucleotidyltransferase family protein [Pseudomonadales bacterium]|nr:nucleotidyltransferase family protein [Pseudomonadales bacterium]
MDLIEFDSINWKLFIQMIKWHRLECHVHQLIIEKRFLSAPTHVKECLKNESYNILLKNMAQTTELAQVLETFDANNIRALPLKGLPLAAKVYGDPAKRYSSDIDLLVSKKDLTTAVFLLESQLGFTLLEELRQIYDHNLDAYIKTCHHLKLHKSDILIELHWSLSPLHDFNESDFDKLYATRSHEDVFGLKIPCMALEFLIPYLCFHGTGHAWFRLFWLVDIAKLNEQEQLNWSAILTSAHNYGWTRSLLLGYALAEDLLGCNNALSRMVKIQNSTSRFIDSQKHTIHQHFDNGAQKKNYDLSLNPEQEMRVRILQIDGAWKRCVAFLNLCLSPRRADIESIRLPSRLYYLYYFVRPIRLLRKTLTKFR